MKEGIEKREGKTEIAAKTKRENAQQLAAGRTPRENGRREKALHE